MYAISPGRSRRFPARASSGIALALGALALAALLLVRDPGPAAAQRPAPSRIAGTVQNGTGGGVVPAGFEVALLRVSGGQILDVQTKRLDELDTFEFTDLDASDAVRYRLSWEYAGVTQTIRIEEEIAPANLPLWIYETTGSPGDVLVSYQETILASVHGRSRLLGVLEQAIILNAGDRTFIPDISTPGADSGLLEFSLPRDAEDLIVDSTLPQGSMMELDAGFVLLNPVPPGEHRVVYSYLTSYGGSAIDFDKALPFGADELLVLVPADIGVARGDGFEARDDVLLGETTYRAIAGGGYARGARAAFTVEGLPEPSFFQDAGDFVGDNSVVTVGVLGVTAALMIGMVAYLLSARRRRSAAPAPATPAERGRLLDEIAALDDRHDAGQISDDEHRRQRERLTERAVAGTDPPGEAGAPAADDGPEDSGRGRDEGGSGG
ncbi:MAG: SHOCT domain-containing protein [Dehalococcoidia bacterium]